MKKNLKSVVNLLFEVGILSKTPRSGFHFLGSGEQSVSEHLTRTMYAGYVIATLEGDVNTGRVIEICMFHDLPEARTSDLNYVHQKYVQADEQSAIKELAGTLDFGKNILSLLTELKEKKTKEAIVAKDADNIEWLLSLKEQVDIGNTRAKSWIPSTVKRLKTKSAKALAEVILDTNSDEWWFSNQDDEWWVSRGKKTLKKRF